MMICLTKKQGRYNMKDLKNSISHKLRVSDKYQCRKKYAEKPLCPLWTEQVVFNPDGSVESKVKC